MQPPVLYSMSGDGHPSHHSINLHHWTGKLESNQLLNGQMLLVQHEKALFMIKVTINRQVKAQERVPFSNQVIYTPATPC